jgi:radical S-adenosyl methionine domain-containing protein 2
MSNQMNTPTAVNWHCEPVCNYHCNFCYAPFAEQRKQSKMSKDDGIILIESLASEGVEKINFVGGEPKLHPHLDDWITASKKAGMTTSIVSNGTGMTREWLTRMRPHLDWLGLSIDASNDMIHAIMGRARIGEYKAGFSKHLERALKIADIANELGYGIKLNTVVTSANKFDDMSEVVKRVNPVRWKVFQVLKIEGENDGSVEPFLIRKDEFNTYVNRHKISLLDSDIALVDECNEEMLGTYAMIDSLGRVYTNMDGRYKYSTKTIQEAGFTQAWAEVSQGFSTIAFEARGGQWDWEASMGVAM